MACITLSVIKLAYLLIAMLTRDAISRTLTKK
jgi:hypothetical protein